MKSTDFLQIEIHLVDPRSHWFGWMIIAIVVHFSHGGYGQNLPEPQNNIILIMVDQMRPDHLIGKHTPNLSKLAQNGVLFTHAYTASPLCQPSRTSIITGLYPSQTKIYGNQTGPIHEDLRNQTFMNILQEGGYYTAFIGKHHYIDRYATGINMVNSDREKIKEYGFDKVIQVADILEHIPNDNHTENIDDYINYLTSKGLRDDYFEQIRNGIKSGIHPLRADHTEDGFIGNQAIDFINTYNQNQPFYLGVSFISPHPPYVVPEEFILTDPSSVKSPVKGRTNPAIQLRRARYMDMITMVDHYIGKMIDALEQQDQLKNTTIIFTSDHGDNLGDYDIWDKRYFYENSVGVPMIVSGAKIPGEDVRIGSIQSKALVSTLDIYPTILSLAGLEKPERIPGINLLDIIAGNPDNLRDAVYSQLGTLVMIRTARWKMVFDPEQGGACYLFNLLNDPQELHNLAGTAGYEFITAELTEKLLKFYIQLDQSTQMKEQLRLQQVRVGH